MTVLVTGASGFVGSRLTARLRGELGQHRRVIGWDRTPLEDWPVIPGIERWNVDLTDAGAVDAALRAEPPEIVFHLAGITSVRQAEGAARQTYDVNVGGTASLAAALCVHAPGALVIFASSGEVYGGAFASGEPLTETAAVRPLNAYARSKLAAEILLRDRLSETCPVVAMRLLNHSGPGQDERFVIPAFAAQIARIEKGLIPPTIAVGNLDVERDFLDVSDVIDGYMKAFDLAGSAAGFEIYNICSGRPRSIRSVLEQLLSLTTVKPLVEPAPELMRPQEIARTVCDASAFQARTGWQPKRDFSETTTAILDWWRSKIALST